MTARRNPREQDAAGTVRARFTAADAFDSGFLIRILREHPEVELIQPPAHYSGGRVYVTFRVRRETAGERV